VKDMKDYLVLFDKQAKELAMKSKDAKYIEAELLKILPKKSRGEFLVPSNIKMKYLKESYDLETEPVKIRSSIGNSEWTLMFDIIGEKPVKEIFYHFDNENTFRSTGFNWSRDPATGLPIPNFQVDIVNPTGRRTLFVKYTDSTGREHGPYSLVFDVNEQVVAWAKTLLEMTKNSWVSFREYPKGEMIVYFTHLIGYKNSLKEIQYSVDDESLSKRVRFKPDWSIPGAPGIHDEDEIYM